MTENTILVSAVLLSVQLIILLGLIMSLKRMRATYDAYLNSRLADTEQILDQILDLVQTAKKERVPEGKDVSTPETNKKRDHDEDLGNLSGERLKHMVIALKKSGLANHEIATQLKKPIGVVDLMVRLHEAEKSGQTSLSKARSEYI